MSETTSHMDAERIPLSSDVPVWFPSMDAESDGRVESIGKTVCPADLPPGDGMAGFSHMRRVGVEDLLF